MFGDYEVKPERIARGPWYRTLFAQHDGLEIFYVRKHAGKKEILLSNNMTWEDREAMQHMYLSAHRLNALSRGFGALVAFELYTHMLPSFPAGLTRAIPAALGAVTAYYFLTKSVGKKYTPLLNAYFNKYEHCVKNEFFDITDRKREWFDIDTSVPTAYSSQEVAEAGYHIHHGPQPDGEVFNNSWLEEMSKFLNGEPNSFKQHPNFMNYKFDTYERKVPTAQDVDDLFARAAAAPKAHRSNLSNM